MVDHIAAAERSLRRELDANPGKPDPEVFKAWCALRRAQRSRPIPTPAVIDVQFQEVPRIASTVTVRELTNWKPTFQRAP